MVGWTHYLFKQVTQLRVKLLLLTLGVSSSLVSCGENPVTNNPISAGGAGTRVQTPETRPFSELNPGEDPVSKSLVGTFILTPEQLEIAASSELTLPASEVNPCVECYGLPLTPEALAQFATSSDVKGLGSFLPDDFKLVLKTQIPDTNPVGKVVLSTRFELSTLTQLINPGNGARLEITQAYLQDAQTDPQSVSEAIEISDPVDFESKQINQGQSGTESIELTFETANFQPRFLKLEAIITSPIPGQGLGKVQVPGDDQIYYGTTFHHQEAPPNQAQLKAYFEGTSKSAAWIGIEQDWQADRAFPTTAAQQILEAGSIPYLRLMLPQDIVIEANSEQQSPLQAIIDGEQDSDWQAWAQEIKALNQPILIALGYLDPANSSPVEPESLERQLKAYRHIIQVTRQQAVDTVLWIYHPNVDQPDSAAAYPGDEFIDWLGFDLYVNRANLSSDPPQSLNSPPPSTFAAPIDGLETVTLEDSGPQLWQSFQVLMDQTYPKVAALSSGKPIVLSGFAPLDPPDATTEKQGAAWVKQTLTDLVSKRWPRLIGFTWDNTYWPVDQSIELRTVFTEALASEQILGQVITQPTATTQPTPIPSPATPPPWGETPGIR